MRYFLVTNLVLSAWQVSIAADLEQPVGFVSSASGGAVTPTGLRAPIAARAGDLLFPGDSISGAPGSVVFFFCLENGKGRRISLLAPVTLSAGLAPTGTSEDVNECLLPRVERWPNVAVVPEVRSMMGPRTGLANRIRELDQGRRDRLEALAQSNLSEPRVKMAFGVLLQEAGLPQDAAWQYLDLAGLWPDQPRLRKLVFDLVHQPATREILHPEAKSNAVTSAGRTFALVIGISRYQQKSIPDLRFAANDAKEFASYLRTSRGGATEIEELTDDQATSGAIRQTFNALYKKAGPRDTVVLLVAAHGDMDPVRHIPMVVTHRANPEDLTINSFPMSEIQLWMLGRKAPFARAVVFLDVCHAGHFAEFQRASGPPRSAFEYFGLLATHRGPDAYAYESDRLGNGHGAFTYFLLRGLNTDEAKDADGQFVSLADLTNYVTQNVSFVTRNKQLPTPMLGASLETHVADLTKTGLSPFASPAISQLRFPAESLRVPRGRAAKQSMRPHDVGPSYRRDLARTIEIENKGEDVLLKYLRGDEVAQNETDFRDCKEAFRELLVLEPGSPYLGAREAFCEGRAEVFRASRENSAAARKHAAELLERAVRLDPGAAYPYNAIGILWLEQGQYGPAEAAFQDAIHWAPEWAYPRHNLALTLYQAGDYSGSVDAYKDAKRIAPNVYYLPYSLGLIYQRTNRLDEAEDSYRIALRLAPSRPEAYTGIGTIHALRGEWKRAESFFRQAMQQPDPLPVAAQAARHNLALTLARKPAGEREAVSLWKQNAGYVPSELSMAEFLELKAGQSHWRNSGANAATIEQYRAALSFTGPDLHLQMRLAIVLQQSGQIEAAIAGVQNILARDARDVAILERLGDLLLLMNRSGEACEAYERALFFNKDATTSGRLSRKKKTCASPHK